MDFATLLCALFGFLFVREVILVAADENVPAGIRDEKAGWSDWLGRAVWANPDNMITVVKELEGGERRTDGVPDGHDLQNDSAMSV